MCRILLPFSAALAACSPSTQKAAMPSSSTVPSPQNAARGSSETRPDRRDSVVPKSIGHDTGGQAHAAQGPIPEPVSAAENPAPAPQAAFSAEALGRRTMSTAFVMEGPDRLLTVELQDGRVLVLRDIVMRPGDYCGVEVDGGTPGTRYCGRYADVVAARPGGATTDSAEPAPAAANPFRPDRGPPGHR